MIRILSWSATIALLSTPSVAQVWNSAGDVIALTQTGGHQLVNTATLVGTPINWGTFVPPTGEAYDVDALRTGSFLYSASPDPTFGIRIYRTQLAGAMAIAQSVVMTIPNSIALTPRQLYREFSGSYLLLSQGPAGRVLHRLGLATGNGIARTIPAVADIDMLVSNHQALTDVASDTQGRIYITGPTNGGTGATGRVWRIETDETTWSAPWESRYLNPYSVAVNHYNNDTLAVGGQNLSLIVGPFNFYCGPDTHAATSLAGLQLIGNCPFGVAGVVHISLDVTATAVDWITAENCGFNSSQRFTATNCSAAAASPVWVSTTGGILKIQRADPPRYQPRFGYGCPAATGMPFIEQVLAPRINQPWVMGLTAAPPSSAVAFAFGFSDAVSGGVPLPFAFDPLFDCVLFNSVDANVPLVSTAMGTASITVPIPNMPSLIGANLFSQWYGASGTTLWITAGARSTIG